MFECKKYRIEIEDSSRGKSDGARAHAETCGECGEALRAGESLGRILRGLERVEAPADFEFRLRARIAARKGGRGRLQLARFGSLSGYATATAALCVLALAASLYFLPRQPPATPEARNVSEPVVDKTAIPQPSGEHGLGPANTWSPPEAKVNLPALASRQTNGDRPRIVAPSRIKGTSDVLESRKALRSNTLSLTGAPVINLPFKIEVGAPAEPLRVVLRDEKGTARVVPVRQVSFGAQELLSHEVAGAKNEEGVW